MKKLFAIFLALAMLLSILPFACAASNSFSDCEYGYKSQNNEIITSLDGQTAVKGYAKVSNNTNTDKTLALILAQYDKSDRLLAVKTKQVTVSSDTDTSFATQSIPVSDFEGAYFKLFTTKDLTGLQPIATVPPLTAGKAQASLTVSSDQMENCWTDENKRLIFEYFETDTSRNTTKITIDKNAQLYYNGFIMDFKTDILRDYYGYASFEKKNADSSADYDTIYIDDYETIVVNTNSTSSYKITSKNATKFVSYDPTDASITAKLYDENGSEMPWESLKTDDIVAIRRFSDASKTVVTGNKLPDSNKITGMVKRVLDEGSPYVEFTINGKKYSIDPKALGYDDIALGDEGTFFIDIMGGITYYSVQINTKYAYIVKVGDNGNSLDRRAALRLYTSDGEYKIFTTAAKVEIDGISGINSSNDFTSDIAVTKTGADAKSIIRKQGKMWFVTGSDSNGDTITAVKALAPGQVITYKLNAEGYITSIERAANKTEVYNTKGKFTQFDVDKPLIYRSGNGALSGAASKVFTTDNTVIMVAPTLDYNGNVIKDPDSLTIDDFALININKLIDEQEFLHADIYDVNDDKEVGFILVNSIVDLIDPTSVISLVSRVELVIDDDNEYVYALSVLQNGIAKENNDALLTAEDNAYDIQSFDTIIPKYDLRGRVKGATILAKIDYDSHYDYNYRYGVDFSGVPENTEKIKYLYGKVTGKYKNGLDIAGGRGTDITAASTANVYIYGQGGSIHTKATLGSLDVIEYSNSNDEFYVDGYPCYVYAIAREYDGDVTDVVLYIFRQ